MNAKGVSRTHVEVLDFARFFAASIVAIGHILYFTPFVSSNNSLVELFMPFHTGAMAVNYFFCLSGYVLILQLDRCKSRIRWIMSRLVRLLPLLWVGLILGLLSDLINSGNLSTSRCGILISFLGVQAAFSHFLLNINQPLWSLSVELLLTPLMLLLKIFQQRVISLISLLAISIVVTQFLISAIFMAIPYFVSGTLIATLPKLPKTRIISAIFYLSIISYFLFAKQVYLMGNSPAWLAIKCLLFISLFVVLLAVDIPNEFKGICTFLGKRTFALYVVHFPISTLIREWMRPNSISQLAEYVAICLVSIIFFTELAFRLVDSKAIDYSRKILYTN